MTELLQEVIAKIEKLPAKEQDAFAKFLLAELESEQKWSELFDSTTDDQWNSILEEVRSDIANGDTKPLEDVFPCDETSS